MNIQTRLKQLEEKIMSKTEDFIMVCIGDNNGVEMCNQRRNGCPEYPCKAGLSCWARQAYPDMKIIKVDGNDQ